MHASELVARLAGGCGPAALVVVVDARGSAPRHPGSKMLVLPGGRTIGTVGGGIVEARAIERSLQCIAAGRSAMLEVEMLGETAVGVDSICGGTVSMALFFVSGQDAFAEASRSLEHGRRVVVVSSLPAGDAVGGSPGVSPPGGAAPGGARPGGGCVAVVEADGRMAWGAGAAVDEAAMRTALDSGMPVVSAVDGLLYDPVEPRDRLVILGGGHVGQALARLASELDFAVCVADSRPDYVDPARFPAGTETRLGNFTDIIADYPFGASTYAVVVGPSHSIDLECVRAVLKREYRYAGFIGSRRKTRMIMDQAVADGFSPEKVAALRAPIGADIGAETPAEIAVSILAEIVAVRRNSPAIAAMDADRVRRRG